MTKTTFLFPEDDEPKDEPDFEKNILDDQWMAFVIKASEIFEKWRALKNRLFHRPPRENHEETLSLPKHLALVCWLRCKKCFKKSRNCRQGLFKRAPRPNPESSMTSITPSIPKIQYLFELAEAGIFFSNQSGQANYSLSDFYKNSGYAPVGISDIKSPMIINTIYDDLSAQTKEALQTDENHLNAFFEYVLTHPEKYIGTPPFEVSYLHWHNSINV